MGAMGVQWRSRRRRLPRLSLLQYGEGVFVARIRVRLDALLDGKKRAVSVRYGGVPGSGLVD